LAMQVARVPPVDSALLRRRMLILRRRDLHLFEKAQGCNMARGSARVTMQRHRRDDESIARHSEPGGSRRATWRTCLLAIPGFLRNVLRVGRKTLGKLFKKEPPTGVRATGTVGRVITRCHTGRSIPAGADYELAQEWAGVGPRDGLLSHPAAARFRRELASTPAVAGTDLLCFRGRREDPITSWRDMGPPDRQEQGNRYNPPGTVALYTSDSVDGVFRELAAKGGTKVFLQDYESPSDVLRLADFSSVSLTDFMKAVFDMAESSSVEGRVGPSGYAFCQVVGQLVREAGFEGMVVPGVRGDPGFQYRNIVVFDAHDRWPTWSRKDAGFRYVIAPDAAL